MKFSLTVATLALATISTIAQADEFIPLGPGSANGIASVPGVHNNYYITGMTGTAAAGNRVAHLWKFNTDTWTATDIGGLLSTWGPFWGESWGNAVTSAGGVVGTVMHPNPLPGHPDHHDPYAMEWTINNQVVNTLSNLVLGNSPETVATEARDVSETGVIVGIRAMTGTMQTGISGFSAYPIWSLPAIVPTGAIDTEANGIAPLTGNLIVGVSADELDGGGGGGGEIGGGGGGGEAGAFPAATAWPAPSHNLPFSLGTFGGTITDPPSGAALDVNDAGYVVGFMSADDGGPFVFHKESNRPMQKIYDGASPLIGRANSVSGGLHGFFVGEAIRPSTGVVTPYYVQYDGHAHGFFPVVWMDGVFDGWTIVTANSITDNGDFIVGMAIDDAGNQGAYLYHRTGGFGL